MMDKLRLLFETKSKSFGGHVRESLPIKPNICEEIIRLESLSTAPSSYLRSGCAIMPVRRHSGVGIFFAPPLARHDDFQLSDTLYG